MRNNPVKACLAGGGTAFGAMIFEFFTPGIAQIVRAAGADFILYDMEHSGIDIEGMKIQLSACRGLDLVPLVRVPTLQTQFITRCLDLGAMGVMVPMVETADQARAIVEATRYPPSGRRGAAFGVAHDDYLGGAVTEKIAAAHERTTVIALVETAIGLANVDAIAAVDGVDIIWLGHFDLTNFMGIPAQFTHPDYLAAVDTIVAAATRHGKTAGIMAADVAWGRDYRQKGFRAIAYGLDLALFQGTLTKGLSSLRAAAGPA